MKSFSINRTIPSHMYLKNRMTGQPVGPFIPVDPNDWPYGELHPSAVLWKYMDLQKFKDMLERSTLYFRRLDKLDDPFEGQFSEANLAGLSPTSERLEEAYRFGRTIEEAKSQHERHRRCLFTSCWHMNHKEQLSMWRAYTTSCESVVIKTSAKALETYVPKSIIKSTVRYHTPDFRRTEFDWNALAFYKPSKYSFEREFRLLRTLQPGESFLVDDLGQRVVVPIRKIIHQVVTHPNASVAFKTKITDLMGQYLPGKNRRASTLIW